MKKKISQNMSNKEIIIRKILNLCIGIFLIGMSILGFIKSYKYNFFGSIIFLTIFFIMGIYFLLDKWVA